MKANSSLAGLRERSRFMKWSSCAAIFSIISLLNNPPFFGTDNALAAEKSDSKRPDLSGTAKDQESQPVPDATVFVWTAGPKEGTGVLCPSCYADCGKKVTTDKEGHF